MLSLLKRNLLNFDDFDLLTEKRNVPVNVKEKPEYYNLEIAAPGFDKNDFKIELDGNRLLISGFKKIDETDKYLSKEYEYSFQRTFMLDENIHAEKINAKYDAGILNLNIPKKQIKQKLIQIV